VSSIEFAARDAAAFTTDGRVVDLGARYALLNLQLDLRARRLLLGVFGETSVATIVCTGVHRYFSPASTEPHLFADDSQTGDTRFDGFEVSDGTHREDRGSRVLRLATDGGLALDTVCTGLELARGRMLSATGADTSTVSSARRTRRTPWLHTEADSLDPSTGLALDVVEIDLANRVVRLVTDSAGNRRLLELQGVRALRLGPPGEDMVARTASATPARGEPVLELTVDRDRLAPDSTLRLRTSGGLDLTMQAALMSLGRLP